MLSTISTGQFIGSCIDEFVFILTGAYIAFLWPKKIKKDIATGKLTEEQAAAKFKIFRPWVGYAFMILAIIRMAGHFLDVKN